MSEPENMILELLRAIRTDIASIKEDVREIKTRVTILESGVAGIRRDLGDLSMSIAAQQSSHDRLVARVERIERRLDLAEAPL